MSEPEHVGGWHRKVGAMDRMRGVAKYTDDLSLPGMLHAKIVRSPHAHANILAIDASAALALDGVHAVITGSDMPVPYGIIPWTRDENALCVDKALYAVICQAWIDGVSTRKVDQLMRALGNDTGISRSTVSRICTEIDEAVAEFLHRRIDQDRKSVV